MISNPQPPASIPGAWETAKEAGYYPVPFHQAGVYENGKPKYSFPDGVTGGGHELQYVSYRPGDTFMGFRLPHDVIALDVDHYDEKQGMVNLAAYREDNNLPSLPLTYRITSRGKDDAGKMLFKVYGDAGSDLFFKRNACANVEIITSRHMFVGGVPGTVHHKTGDLNQCFGPDGEECELPDEDELPRLPVEWVKAITTDPAVLADVDAVLPGDDGYDCPRARSWLEGYRRHELTREGWVLEEKSGADFAGGQVRGVREFNAVVYLKTLTIHGHHVGKVIEDACELSEELKITIDKRWEDAKGHAVDDSDCCKNTSPESIIAAVQASPVLTAVPVPVPVPELMTTTAVEVPESDANSLLLPSTFWESHDMLRYVRDSAWAGQSCPDAVLHCLLARVAAAAPPDMRLNTGIKTPASLNYFAALCGKPGSGKTDANTRAEILASQFHNAYEKESFGSGEGIADAYLGYEYVPDPGGATNADGSPKMVRSTRTKVQVRSNCFFFSDEGHGFIVRMQRPESTLGERFRSAWMGEDLIDSNAKDENKRKVRGYALGAVVGFQPRTVGAVVDEVHLGTAQRFAYVWATDPSSPFRHPAPAHRSINLKHDPRKKVIDLGNDTDGECMVMMKQGGDQLTVDPAITNEMEVLDWNLRRGAVEIGQADTHRNLMRAKVAALLMLLFGEGPQVSEYHWKLAGMIMDTSDAVRENVRRLSYEGRAEDDRLFGEVLARRERGKAFALTTQERAEAKVSELLAAGVAYREISHKLSRSQRRYFPSVESIEEFEERLRAA